MTETAQPQSAAEAVIDRLRRLFDPKKFRTGPDGKPRFDKLGRFVNLRGGRKKKTTMDTPSPAPASPAEAAPVTSRPPEQPGQSQPPPSLAAAAPAPDAPDFSEIKKILEADEKKEEVVPGLVIKNADEYTLAAAGVVSSISTVAILGMGAHAKPSNEQTVALVEAYAACFRHYGYMPKPAPWLAPVLVTFTVFGPHLADERSQTNLQKWKRKAVNAWMWIRGKVDGRAAASAASDAQQ